jgi:Na+/H+ antiporter NhaC
MEFGFLSLLPPLVAIVLAVMTRRVILPLALGVGVGAYLLTPVGSAWWQPAAGFAVAISESIFAHDHLQALAFSLLLGAMVGVLEAGGAMESLVASLANRIRTRRGAQTMIATSGLAIFFDDYANTLLVGGTMRSTSDRYRISRSKLAYLVDSTAAPVAGLSVISTWAATEVSYMVDGLQAAGITDPSAGFELFLRSIPYRFYPCLALVMVFLVARSGRDFGPMRAAEQEAVDGGVPAEECVDGKPKSPSQRRDARRAWLPTVLPVLICIGTVVAVLVATGYQVVGPKQTTVPWWRYLGLVIGNGHSYWALVAGGAAGWISTLVAHRLVWRTNLRTLFDGSSRGAWQMVPAMLILWFAWALSSMTGDQGLDTGGFLAGMLSDSLDARLLPTLVFLIAGVMAFSTGTSWGTMAILTPLSVTLALKLGAAAGGGLGDPAGAICLATCGSVLAGAIFGDHCSPISDTTVLSSRASGCDHVQHVRTQMPYALVVGLVCILVGCVPAALGVSPWISLALGTAVLWAVLRWFGHAVG